MRTLTKAAKQSEQLRRESGSSTISQTYNRLPVMEKKLTAEDVGESDSHKYP
jgi:hypothetical protein